MLNSNFWKSYFKVYDVLNLLIPYQELLGTICDELDIKPGEKILEAGCGTGNLALKIKERGAKVIGLDNCQEALNIYRKKDPKAKLILADLKERLPFPDNYFDKIASSNTLYAIPQNKQLETLKEFHRVLKPGGKIVIVNPHEKNRISKIYMAGVKASFRKNGLITTLRKMIQFLPATIKIFYYNYLIDKGRERKEYCFFDKGMQKELLRSAGFRNLSEDKLIYANQNILSSAEKTS